MFSKAPRGDRININNKFLKRDFELMLSKVTFIIYTIALLLLQKITKFHIIFLLLFFISELIKGYFLKSKILKVGICCAQLIGLIFSVNIFSTQFFILLPLSILDLLFLQSRLLALILTLVAAFLIPKHIVLNFLLFSLIFGVCSYFEHSYYRIKMQMNMQLDNERRLRYQLEQLRLELLDSQKQIERLSVLKERDRIARELHDSLGHSLSALNIQLNALYKIIEKEDNLKYTKQKLHDMADSMRTQAAATLEMLRKTVYDMKIANFEGIEALKKLIYSFEFCPTQFEMNIGREDIPAFYSENILAIVKEALINISRHSDANLVKINLDIKNRYIRLFIKDNGTKGGEFKEGVGISNMRLRVKNMGGSINIDNSDGFMIVVFIPLKDEVISE